MLRTFFTSRRGLLIIGFVVLLVVVAVVLRGHKSSTNNVAGNFTTNSAGLQTIPINNFDDFPSLDAKFKSSLGWQLFDQMQQSVSNITSDDYGLIRAGSVSTSQTTQIVGTDTDISVAVTKTVFIIDIPNAKRTYEGQIFTDQYGQVSQSYVLCPTKQENKYGAFYCVNQQ